MTEEQSGEARSVRLDHRQIRVLAHPLRIRLLGALRADGPATATSLAVALDTNTGATSYHLRQLAEVGLVAEEAGRGTARQRWWRAVHDTSSWYPSDYDDDPDARAALEWVQVEHVKWMTEQADRWLTERVTYSPQWRDAAGLSDAFLVIGPERLTALNQEISELVRRYREASAPDEADARPVHLVHAAFPAEERDR
ncbi:transcriptional regulator [Micromonospora echinospora]|uniref:Transcriptional regulator, ArsR family n=1 Tax=Micromonospora echinospora TaxID=1877 RepID=A0A1C5A6Z0_MICEC|nr:helix-turn-helix domain-containing protein [Micromonospora echinospora]OZV78736.1 transcriptional regulator [Micromonospora echinospora]SCF41013.1 transcriptional regulator, ArsR family [Micromonospora echinospora]